jgi:hypothetical protein
MSARPKKETEWQRRKRRDTERAAHVAEHGPGCELCGNVPRVGLHEDHAHRSGLHRGWLDHRCNRALPTWVTPTWLIAAALYLHDRDPDSEDLAEPWGYMRDYLAAVEWPGQFARWGKP